MESSVNVTSKSNYPPKRRQFLRLHPIHPPPKKNHKNIENLFANHSYISISPSIGILHKQIGRLEHPRHATAANRGAPHENMRSRQVVQQPGRVGSVQGSHRDVDDAPCSVEGLSTMHIRAIKTYIKKRADWYGT